MFKLSLTDPTVSMSMGFRSRTTERVETCQRANKRLFLSLVDPKPTPTRRWWEGVACCVKRLWVTATWGLIALMGKFCLLKSGNVRGEVWRMCPSIAGVVTFVFLTWSPRDYGDPVMPQTRTETERFSSFPLSPSSSCLFWLYDRLFLAAESAPALLCWDNRWPMWVVFFMATIFYIPFKTFPLSLWLCTQDSFNTF